MFAQPVSGNHVYALHCLVYTDQYREFLSRACCSVYEQLWNLVFFSLLGRGLSLGWGKYCLDRWVCILSEACWCRCVCGTAYVFFHSVSLVFSGCAAEWRVHTAWAFKIYQKSPIGRFPIRALLLFKEETCSMFVCVSVWDPVKCLESAWKWGGFMFWKFQDVLVP